MHHLVLSQSTRVTDGRTDRRTDRITTPKTALVYARAVKKRIVFDTCNNRYYAIQIHY